MGCKFALYTMMHDLTLQRDGILPFLCESVARFRHQFAILFWGDDETVGVGMDEFDIKDVSVSKDPLVKAFALARHLDEEIKIAIWRIVQKRKKYTLQDFGTHVENQMRWLADRIKALDAAENVGPYVCLQCGMMYKAEPDQCDICNERRFLSSACFRGRDS